MARARLFSTLCGFHSMAFTPLTGKGADSLLRSCRLVSDGITDSFIVHLLHESHQPAAQSAGTINMFASGTAPLAVGLSRAIARPAARRLQGHAIGGLAVTADQRQSPQREAGRNNLPAIRSAFPIGIRDAQDGLSSVVNLDGAGHGFLSRKKTAAAERRHADLSHTFWTCRFRR